MPFLEIQLYSLMPSGSKRYSSANSAIFLPVDLFIISLKIILLGPLYTYFVPGTVSIDNSNDDFNQSSVLSICLPILFGSVRGKECSSHLKPDVIVNRSLIVILFFRVSFLRFSYSGKKSNILWSTLSIYPCSIATPINRELKLFVFDAKI